MFTEKFDRIKPREHRMLRVDVAETVFEPHVGGWVFDRGVDGSEYQSARDLARHGDGWPGLREGVGGDDGWPLYLHRYGDVISAEA